MATTFWHKGSPLTEEQFAELQAEKAARRPADASDRCLMIRGGGGAICMRQLPSRPSRFGQWWHGFKWEGRNIHRDESGGYVAIRARQWSNASGTRG